MPLTERAKSSVIMTAKNLQTDVKEDTQLAEFLGRRGFSVGRQILEKTDGPVGSELLNMCYESGINFLVIGAYTRSRLRQWILSGVTSYILENSELPVVMAR
jgi:nucleotide-binding universal stress UspA family protein